MSLLNLAGITFNAVAGLVCTRIQTIVWEIFIVRLIAERVLFFILCLILGISLGLTLRLSGFTTFLRLFRCLLLLFISRAFVLKLAFCFLLSLTKLKGLH